MHTHTEVPCPPLLRGLMQHSDTLSLLPAAAVALPKCHNMHREIKPWGLCRARRNCFSLGWREEIDHRAPWSWGVQTAWNKTCNMHESELTGGPGGPGKPGRPDVQEQAGAMVGQLSSSLWKDSKICEQREWDRWQVVMAGLQNSVLGKKKHRHCALGLGGGSGAMGLPGGLRWAQGRRDMHCVEILPFETDTVGQDMLFGSLHQDAPSWHSQEMRRVISFLSMKKMCGVTPVPSCTASSHPAKNLTSSYQCRKITASVLLCP